MTNSFTASSMASAFTGLLPSELEPKGIGWGGCYYKKNEEEKKHWNSKFVFNKLPENWKVITYADEKNKVWLTNNLCGVDQNFEQRVHKNYDDEIQIIKQIQEDKDGNQIYWIKYDHYHDEHSEKSVKRFLQILESIDFNEPDTFFWLFSDHGEWGKIDTFMKPPHSSVGWNVVVDNITNFTDYREICHITDFYHYVMKISNNVEPNLMEDYYFCEDGRASVSLYSTTTFSVLTKIKNSEIVQASYYKGSVKIYHFDYESRLLKESKVMKLDDMNTDGLSILKNKLLDVYGERINNG